MFWISSGLNKVRVIGTGGYAGKSLFVNIFAYFPHLTLFSYVKQIKKMVFQVEKFC